ncbi:hypothetical protein [Companilactobacillus sp. DQM5]|uniref:hypothetical protein n=1 Tax=Companilactobacillus sp. DQM5 TaxID=3463359 RepID=UPI0040583C51
MNLEKEVESHTGRIKTLEHDVKELSQNLRDGLQRVDQSNEYLRTQNNDILKEIIKRNSNAEQRDYELKKLGKTNQVKMFGMIFGASGLAALVLDFLMKLVK